MQILYNVLIHLTGLVIWGAQPFSKKLRLFVRGRKGALNALNKKIVPTDRTIWFHCASLGEYEQGFPIMEAIRRDYPEYKLILTFFSPSGYEVKKNSPVAAVVSYLPMDTAANAAKFIDIVHPTLAIFVKYEIWPNYLSALQKNNTPKVLVSSLFRKSQAYFKPYGGFMRNALRSFDHIFVQNQDSLELLRQLNINNVTLSGDTRFDRVSQQITMDNTLPFAARFKKDSLCVVCGSTWPEDEEVLLPFINSISEGVKFIIAPHTIDYGKIELFRKKLKKNSVLYSQTNDNLNHDEYLDVLDISEVLIIDTIGLLTKLYHYADIAYVGGAMGHTGLHNILEAATFGVPVVIGKNFEKFPEAKRLRSLAGLFSVSDAESCAEIMNKLIKNPSFREKTGMIAEHYINRNTGATNRVMACIGKII